MRYIGGKSKIASKIAKVILDRTTERVEYYEPFVGGGSMLPHMAPHFSYTFASDLSEDLILMWRALRNGWEPPHPLIVSEDEYAKLRDAAPSPIRALVGFGGSFGGKWFGGYARGGLQANGQPRNHQEESAANVLCIHGQLAHRNVSFRRLSYSDIWPARGSVIYCDPPYSETEGYKAAGAFDSAEFWRTANRWVENGCHVFVSEYSAPEDWECVWTHQHRRSLSTTAQGRPCTTEALFTKSTP